MASVVLGVFVLVVITAPWLASRRGQQSGTGCCAPADPRADLRMRGRVRRRD